MIEINLSLKNLHDTGDPSFRICLVRVSRASLARKAKHCQKKKMKNIITIDFGVIRFD